MHMLRGLFAFLLLFSVGLGFINVSGQQPTYNPGDAVNLTMVSNNTNATGYFAHVNFTNSSTYTYNFTCAINILYNGSQVAKANCIIPVDLANGTWNMTIFGNNDPDDKNTTVQFTLNYANMSLVISSIKSFSPGTTFSYTVNTTFQNTTQFSINTSAFGVLLNVSNIVYNRSSLSTISTGYYNATCTINSTAPAGNYSFNGTYPNSGGMDVLNVNITYGTPHLTLNVTSLAMEKNETQNVSIRIRSNSNVDDTILVNATCNGVNITCYTNVTEVNVSYFGTANVTLVVNSTNNGNFTFIVTVIVNSSGNPAYTNQTNLSVTVHPSHNFTITGDSPVSAGASAGNSVQHNFTVTNTGENTTSFNFSCVINSMNFTYSNFNVSNASVAVLPGSSISVHINVTVLQTAPLDEISKINVTVKDSFGLSKLLGGNYFQTQAMANLGNVTVTNVSQYVHYPGETYSFNISVNNTGNIDDEQAYNITIVGQNISNWGINISNGSSLVAINETTTSYSLNLSISKLSSANLSVTVVVPATANSSYYPKLFVMAVSKINGNRSSENSTVIIKIPSFSFSVVMNYSNATETLNFSIQNITKEDSAVTSFSNLTFFIINQSNNKLMANNTNATLNKVYSNSTSNVDVWSSGGYLLNITGSTTPDTPYNLSYNFSFRGVFYIARWLNTTATISTTTATNGQNFTVTVWSWFGNTSLSTNKSTSEEPLLTFLPAGGSSASSYLVTDSNYIFTYTAYTTTNNTLYNINAMGRASYCSRDFTCTFYPVLTNNASTLQITETFASSTGGNQQGAPSGNATNRTTTTTTGIKITMPSNVTLMNTSQTIYIPLNNTNTSRQNITVNISEASDYIHFSLTYVAPKNISGNSTTTVNITLTPFKWAKPGNYTVTVTINSVNSTFTVTVPQPNDTKKIHRYVEVSKDRTKSMVTLGIKNRNSYSEFMNVTENISKQIAASASNLTITSAINYTIIEQDPVILWTMNMSSNQERSIIYLVGGDLGNSNLFIEPNISEGRMSAGGGGGGGGVGGDMTWLIIGIIVVVVIAAAVVVYLFFLKPRGIKLPINYEAFVKREKKGEGVLGVLKGITAKIMSVFKRGEKKEPIAGEKKSLLSRLSFKKKVKEEPKKEEKKIEPGKPKPTKEDLLKKLNEVYKK